MNKIRTLMIAKQLLLEADDAWSNYSNEQTATALDKIEELDGDLLGLDFADPEIKNVGLEILLTGKDSPNFADDFKNQLFARLWKRLTSNDA